MLGNAPSGLRAAGSTASGSRRILLRRDRVVWTVAREGEAPPYRRLVLENPALGVRVRVRTLEDAP